MVALVFTVCGCCLCEIYSLPPGTWKLRSEKIISGKAPLYPENAIMRIDASSKIVQVDKLVAGTVLAKDRMRISLSSDGRTMTQDTTGGDAKSGKAYHYVLVWDKQ